MAKTYAGDDDVRIHCDEFLGEGSKAILVGIDGEEVWLPKSQIDYDAEKGDVDFTVTLPFWLCEKKGLEDAIED